MTRVEIRNNATAEVRDCSDNFDPDIQPSEIVGVFRDSGAGCDCAKGFRFDSQLYVDCGHSRFSVRLTAPDGTRIYSDFAEDEENAE